VKTEQHDPAPGSRSGVLRTWYDSQYSHVAVTAGDTGLGRYMHRSLERRTPAGTAFPKVLEVGGNRGEHVAFVEHDYDQYVLTDLHAPGAAVREDRVVLGIGDVTALPFADATFDRVVSTCVLHHVPDVLAAAGEMRRVVRPSGGVVSILIPTDPGWAYRTGQALTSGRKARRAGMADQHALVHALDHRNHVRSILRQVRHVFRADRVTVDHFPFRVPSIELNAFVVVTAKLGSVG
jgi:phosphatidylethanolamine/phosphatidyl-N-methylethanolamine N-methyltransferase